MSNYVKHLTQSTKTKTQKQRTSADQVKNNAGGFVFTVDKWVRFERFLILGCEGGTFYAGEKKLTIESAKIAVECAREDYARAIDLIVDVSSKGRAPKNDPAIFALALLASVADREDIRKAALDILPQVCRIGTHLFQFAEAVNSLRGWGRSLRRAIGNWYTSKSAKDLAYQVTKYQQRNGWSNRDLLRLSHPQPVSREVTEVIKYAAQKETQLELLPDLIQGVEYAKVASTHEIPNLIRQYNLVREHIPTAHLNSVEVWDALLDKMPMNALVRNLGKMSSIGLLAPLSNGTNRALAKLADADYIKKSKLHPMSILSALMQYKEGHGAKGNLSWKVVPQIVDALDSAFYSAFGNVVPTNKRTMIALDVSGSMGMYNIAGSNLTPREAAAALAMVTAKTEPNYYVVGFCDGTRPTGHREYPVDLKPLDFSRHSRLDSAVRSISNIPFGGTDCALPMVVAQEQKMEVDTFIIITDNETWAGNIHPNIALQKYRQTSGINAKCIVMAMSVSGFTIADPKDSGMLDVVGFDTDVPQIIADFSRN